MDAANGRRADWIAIGDSLEDTAMIPLILLHIALQVGQPQIICNGPCGDPCWKINSTNTGWDYVCGTLKLLSLLPAEHVIEIRSKREIRGPVLVKAGTGPYPHYKFDYMMCPDGFADKQWNEIVTEPQCERVTKTLYLDGQRIGVIREVEEK